MASVFRLLLWPIRLRAADASSASFGVVQIIGSGQVAEPIPAHEIAAIQQLMQSGSSYRPYPYHHLQEGMMVTVIRGPLQGLYGRCIGSASSCRLILAVNLIQQAAAIDIAAEDMALAGDQARLTSQPLAL